MHVKEHHRLFVKSRGSSWTVECTSKIHSTLGSRVRNKYSLSVHIAIILRHEVSTNGRNIVLIKNCLTYLNSNAIFEFLGLLFTFHFLWGTVAHWLEHWTHDHLLRVLAPTRAHCVESLSKTLNPHCSSPPRWMKDMDTGKLSCWEGKTDSFVQE